MRALSLNLTLIMKQFVEVFHGAGFMTPSMTPSGFLAYRADRALD